MRHAEAQKTADSDKERDLTEKGRNDAGKMGDQFHIDGLLPDLIVSSTALRAWKSAHIFATHCGYGGEVIQNPDLYSATDRVLLDLLTNCSDVLETIMIVCHNPAVELFVNAIPGAEKSTIHAGEAAYIEFQNRKWSALDSLKNSRLVLVRIYRT